MSQDQARRLLDAMHNDLEFAREVLAPSRADEVAARARAAGYDITTAEAHAIIPADSRALTDNEMAAVAGGGVGQDLKQLAQGVEYSAEDIKGAFESLGEDFGSAAKDLWDKL